MWGIAQRLNELGVMGINRRNAHYTLAHNPRRQYPLVDNKLRTKELAAAAGIPVPELYGVMQREHQVKGLSVLLQPYEDFVIKPAHGSGGNGILVIGSRTRDKYRTASGWIMTQKEINHHVFNTLSGLYSLGGQPDAALIEYRVQFDPIFDHITFQGVPDIRIIVFLGVPVLAMLRLPTRVSGGKANLHQGAIGAGIDLTTGTTLTAVSHQGMVSEHPDTGNPISGFAVPCWQTMLQTASRCYDLTHLGYLGVDLVLDRTKGPLLLELNARPGLGIQMANGVGLLPRLQMVERHCRDLSTVEDRVGFAYERFKC
jgi:alpha-L-glutamate ligase-like protein